MKAANIAIAPLFHGLGLVGQNGNTLLGVTSVITGGRFDADQFIHDIEHYGVTHIGGSPAMCYGICAAPNWAGATSPPSVSSPPARHRPIPPPYASCARPCPRPASPRGTD